MVEKRALTKILKTIISLYIVVSTLIIGLKTQGIETNDINISKSITELRYFLVHTLAFSNSIRDDTYTKEYVNNVTSECETNECIYRKAFHEWDKIKYSTRYKDVPDLKTLKEKRNNIGRCVAQAMATATVLAHHNITVRYVYQKNHICIHTRKKGFYRCSSEPIRYISQPLDIKNPT